MMVIHALPHFIQRRANRCLAWPSYVHKRSNACKTGISYVDKSVADGMILTMNRLPRIFHARVDETPHAFRKGLLKRKNIGVFLLAKIPCTAAVHRMGDI